MRSRLQQRLNRLLAKLFTQLPVLGRLWSRLAKIDVSAGVPWTPMRKALPDCRVCVITTGGLHLETDRPFDMNDPEGDPTFRRIPADAAQADLTITHNYYDHRDADRDYNILLPLDRLRELAATGLIGGLTADHYSFMGHIDGPHLKTLDQQVLPELLRQIKAEQPDFVFLTTA